MANANQPAKVNDYFSLFPSFHENSKASVLTEFNRLARSQGWGKSSKKYKDQKRNCLRSQYLTHVALQFEPILGHDSSAKLIRLGRLQALCREMGVPEAQTGTITGCRKVNLHLHFFPCDSKWTDWSEVLIQAPSIVGIGTSAREYDRPHRQSPCRHACPSFQLGVRSPGIYL